MKPIRMLAVLCLLGCASTSSVKPSPPPVARFEARAIPRADGGVGVPMDQ